ncbi:MAG: tetratricopeptide repeat protein [Candidatus Omnitrophota bacterium]
MTQTKYNRTKLFISGFVLIICCVFLVYSNSLNSPFIWDDEALVVANPLIKDGGSLAKIFTSDLYYGSSTGSNFYRPLQTLTYLVNYHFWQLEPRGYHITNILLQGLVSFLVLLLAYWLLGDFAVSLAAALLFAVCPLHTEAVTYISGRAEMLMGLFLISSFILFLKSLGPKTKNKNNFFGFSLILFICALLTKELSVLFPLVILSHIFYFAKNRLKKPVVLAKILLPFFATAASYIILRLFFLNFMTLRPPALTKFPFLLRITVFPKVLLTYLKLLIFPVDLHMSREFIRPTTFGGYFIAWFALGSIIAGVFYALRNNRGRKVAPFLLSWFLVFLLPQSGLLAINAFVAEHFLYLSSISFFIAVAYVMNRYLRPRLFIFAVVGLLFFYGTLTFSRNYEWSDPVIFYERILKFSPSSFQAHNNLGIHYQRRSLYQQAIREYEKALEIMPDLLEARSNLADIYFKMGRLDDAKREYAFVEKTAPGSKAGEIQNNIAAIYESQGLWDEALDKYKLALQLDPGLDFTHFNMARVYFVKGDSPLAAQEILNSLSKLNLPEKEVPILLKLIEGYFDSGKRHTRALTFYNDLGVLFAQKEFFDASIVAFQKVLELDLRYSDAHFNLGLAYWKKGLKAKAALEFKYALKINPGHVQAKGMLSEIKKENFFYRISY